MPLDSMNALLPAFERKMYHILKDITLTIVYLEDVFFSNSIGEHELHVRIIFEAITMVGPKLKVKKYALEESNIKIFGHLFDMDRVHFDKENIIEEIEAITPKKRTELQIFLGQATYYRFFIKYFVIIPAVPHSETSGNRKLTWIEKIIKSKHILGNPRRISEHTSLFIRG